LQLSEIDVLLVGGWLVEGVYERFLGELLPVLQRLQQEGKFRYLGSSEKSSHNGAHGWLARGLRDNLFDAVMVAYNLINQSAEREIFPLCKRNDVGVLVIYAVRRVFSRPDRLRDVIADLKKRGLVAQDAVPEDEPLSWLVKGETDSLISAAYKFAVANSAVSSVVTGTIDIRHLEENVNAVLGPPLPREDIERLRQAFGRVCEPIGN